MSDVNASTSPKFKTFTKSKPSQSILLSNTFLHIEFIINWKTIKA